MQYLHEGIGLHIFQYQLWVFKQKKQDLNESKMTKGVCLNIMRNHVHGDHIAL
jgi:hypothetical protein